MSGKGELQDLDQIGNSAMASESTENPSPVLVNNYLLPEKAKALSEWQEKMATVAERDWHMFLNEMYTDCEFSIGEGEKPTVVKSHRAYLSKTSPYFSSMFYGDMKRNSEDVIHLPDVNLESFKAMLKYVYLGELHLHEYSYEVVCGLLHLAKMYLLPIIFREEIRNHLWENIYPDNVWTAIEFGKTNDEPEIEKMAWQLLEMDINICEDTLDLPNFKDISHSMLMALVQMDTIKCPDEEVLFESCLRWARSEAVRQRLDPDPVTLREILADVIPHIRFLAMDKEEFAKDVVESNLFTGNENQPILVFHITGKLKNLSPIFCTKTTVRGKVEDEEFEVFVRPALTDGRDNYSNIKLGDSFHRSTSSVLSSGGVTFSSDADLFGVQVPTQVKKMVSPGECDVTYEENLTLVVRNKVTSKIIAIAPFKSTVNYNSIINVPLETPLRCSEELGNNEIVCSVIFHQSGKYPAVRDTTEKTINIYDQSFHNYSGVSFFYVRSFKYINCIAYKYV